MINVLVVTDSSAVFTEVTSALQNADTTCLHISEGRETLKAVKELNPQLVVLDLQIGSMGGVAAALTLRNEETGQRLPHFPILLLLDREADFFLAKRSQADGWVLKPLDATRLSEARDALLSGETYFDPSRFPASEETTLRSW